MMLLILNCCGHALQFLQYFLIFFPLATIFAQHYPTQFTIKRFGELQQSRVFKHIYHQLAATYHNSYITNKFNLHREDVKRFFMLSKNILLKNKSAALIVRSLPLPTKRRRFMIFGCVMFFLLSCLCHLQRRTNNQLIPCVYICLVEIFL